MDDIDDRARSDRFEVFEERACVPPVRVRAVDTFGTEVVEFLEVGVPALVEGRGSSSGHRRLPKGSAHCREPFS